MTAIDYDEMALIAQEMIEETGRSIKVQKLSAVPADSTKPLKGPATPTVATDIPVFGTFVEVFSFIKLGMEVVDENLLKSVDQGVLVAQASTDIEKFDVIFDNGITWKIEWCRVLKPGSTVLLHWFGVKR
jgi:hypothetical protein